MKGLNLFVPLLQDAKEKKINIISPELKKLSNQRKQFITTWIADKIRAIDEEKNPLFIHSFCYCHHILENKNDQDSEAKLSLARQALIAELTPRQSFFSNLHLTTISSINQSFGHGIPTLAGLIVYAVSFDPKFIPEKSNPILSALFPLNPSLNFVFAIENYLSKGIVIAMLRYGVAITTADIHCAVKSSDTWYLRQLLTQNPHSANINGINSDGNTALHIAVQLNEVKPVEILLANKANISVRNKCGNTPLHFATLSNNTAIIQVLYRQGGESIAHIKNKKNQTPDEIFRKNNNNQSLSQAFSSHTSWTEMYVLQG